MQQIQAQINLFHALFYGCLWFGIFCFALSVLLFFKFDIRNIFNARTGRSVKKAVERAEKRNGGAARPQRTAEVATELSGCSTDPLTGQQVQKTEILPSDRALSETKESFGRFRIEKSILLIHTNEAV